MNCRRSRLSSSDCFRQQPTATSVFLSNLSLSFSLTQTLFLSLSLSHTKNLFLSLQTLFLSLTLSKHLSLTQTLSLSLTHSNPPSLTLSLLIYHKLTYLIHLVFLSLSLSLSLTPSLVLFQSTTNLLTFPSLSFSLTHKMLFFSKLSHCSNSSLTQVWLKHSISVSNILFSANLSVCLFRFFSLLSNPSPCLHFLSLILL